MIQILSTGILNIICFIIGAKIGQTAYRGENIRLSVSPIEAIKHKRIKKQVEQRQETAEKILNNIEKYDGTAKGQEDI